MTKRLRRPKIADGELQIYWGRETSLAEPEILFAWQGESSMKRDTALLHHVMGSKRPNPFSQPFSKMMPSLFEELDARGYDLTTLRFSIKKKGQS